MGAQIPLNRSVYAPIIERMIANSTVAPVVTDKNVYQVGRPANKAFIHEIIADLLLAGSRIDGVEHLAELHELAQKPRACLILMEHFSNYDIPCFFELLESSGDDGRRIADDIVMVAGVKLNEESALVRAFTEVYTRVVIYPSRSISAIDNERARQEAENRRARINFAALRALMKLRRQGKLVLVFPTGTRYRPWDPTTARGLKEIDTYIKFYSFMVLVSINGNTLLPNRNGSMDEDYPVKDVMLFTVSPVLKCPEFRREAIRGREEDENAKQAVVDRIMDRLAEMHAKAEPLRQRLLAADGRV